MLWFETKSRTLEKLCRIFQLLWNSNRVSIRVTQTLTTHSRYVSESQFDGWFYPRYCAGPAYVLTATAVDSLLAKLPEFEVIRVRLFFDSASFLRFEGESSEKKHRLFSRIERQNKRVCEGTVSCEAFSRLKILSFRSRTSSLLASLLPLQG